MARYYVGIYSPLATAMMSQQGMRNLEGKQHVHVHWLSSPGPPNFSSTLLTRVACVARVELATL